MSIQMLLELPHLQKYLFGCVKDFGALTFSSALFGVVFWGTPAQKGGS
jgi:hypothetical protein